MTFFAILTTDDMLSEQPNNTYHLGQVIRLRIKNINIWNSIWRLASSSGRRDILTLVAQHLPKLDTERHFNRERATHKRGESSLG